MMEKVEARKIMKRFDRRLVDETPDCNGVSIRHENGKWRVRVLVRKKRDSHRLLNDLAFSKKSKIRKAGEPLQEGELAVEVVEVGELYPVALTRTDKHRPAMAGISIGHYAITAGTLGCTVYDASGNKRILSNNHVLANCNSGSPGDNIYQPGPYDGGTVADKIGELHSFVTLVFNDSGSPNDVDAALCTPTLPGDVLNEILGLDYPTETGDPSVGDEVTKSGRTTGVTEDNVVEFSGLIGVNYRSFGIGWFDDQIITEVMGAGGDSGSLLMTKTGKACGLLFAGSNSITVFNRISEVLSALSVDIFRVFLCDGQVSVTVTATCSETKFTSTSPTAQASVTVTCSCSCTVDTLISATGTLSVALTILAEAPWAQDPILFASSLSLAVAGFVTNRGYSHYGTNETQGRFRIEQTALDQYELFKGKDAEPDFSAAPFETFSSLPHTTGILSAAFLNNCIARWKMNETEATLVADSSGSANVHDGVSYRPLDFLAIASGNPPNLNGAFNFNGTSDFIAVVDHDDFDFAGMQDFSIWFWFRKTTDVSGFVINHRKKGNYNGWDIWYQSGQIWARISKGTTNFTWATSVSGGVNDGNWHSCGVMFDRDSLGVTVIDDGTPYIDSVSMSPANDIASSENLCIGSRLSQHARWDGELDCLFIFNKILSAADRAFLHNSGNGRECFAEAGTFNLVLRKRNKYNLSSQNIKSWSVRTDDDGVEIAPCPDAPQNITFVPAAGGKGRATAQYFYDIDDNYAATKWLIYFTDDGTDPDPDNDTPTEATMHKSNGVAHLDWLSPAADHNDTLKIIIRTRYEGATNVDSQNTDVHQTTASTAGPSTPTGRSFAGRSAELM